MAIGRISTDAAILVESSAVMVVIEFLGILFSLSVGVFGGEVWAE